MKGIYLSSRQFSGRITAIRVSECRAVFPVRDGVTELP